MADEPTKPPFQRKRTMSYRDDEDEVKPDDGKVRMQRSITLFNGVSIIVGCIIGSGIFIAPKGIQEQSGSVGVSLIIWAVCGLFCGLGAYCYAELGTLIRRTGGDYAYIMAAFGPMIAFIRLWIEAIVVRPCTAAVVALTFALYILRPFYPHCDPPNGLATLIAATTLIMLTAINCISVHLAARVQDFFMVAKVFALILIICTGIALLCTGKVEYRMSFDNLFEGTSPDLGKHALAMFAGLFAYNGWNYLNFIVEELQNPKRNLPLAILISMVLCTIIYVLTNIAFYTAISPEEMLLSPAVAVEFANKLYGHMAWIMPIFVSCSTVGSANGVILTSSRLFYAGAREQHMPQVLTMIHRSQLTPVPAVIFTGLISLCYLAMSDNVFTLINYIQIVYFLAIGMAIGALFYLRKKMPDAPRPIKVNLIFPIIFFIGCVYLVVVPIYAAPLDSAIGLGIMLSGVPVYLFFIHWQNKPRCINDVVEYCTGVTQKLFLVVPEDV